MNYANITFNNLPTHHLYKVTDFEPISPPKFATFPTLHRPPPYDSPCKKSKSQFMNTCQSHCCTKLKKNAGGMSLVSARIVDLKCTIIQICKILQSNLVLTKNNPKNYESKICKFSEPQICKIYSVGSIGGLSFSRDVTTHISNID